MWWLIDIGIFCFNCSTLFGCLWVKFIFGLYQTQLTVLYIISTPPDTVRLGDQNLVRQDDNAQPQDYQVANVIVHPDYRHSSNYNDIALIRLSTQVT